MVVASSTEPDKGTSIPSGPADTAESEDGSSSTRNKPSAIPEDSVGVTGTDLPDVTDDVTDIAANSWDSAAVYTGGDTVSYEGCLYRAKWWTQGETPNVSDVWEDLGILAGMTVQPEGMDNSPINASVPQDSEVKDFKVVGYYPSWKPDRLSSVDFNIITHVCYAFAIPTSEGELLDLENPDTARALIRSAHDNGAKVLLSVGGWSYNDTPLESVFMEATADETRLAYFVENILSMCQEYGFDGVDMDWEHPRVDGGSARQYEALMLALAEGLHAQDKLLTATVLSGATADGNIYYDAAAHTNAVLNAVDFINVMAYDGGDGERHSSYQFAIDCGTYWKETRGLPACKIVLGVPFYARPGWADYGIILSAAPDACKGDHASYNGMDVYYNGPDTIADKTRYAIENLGGVMVWELTQDTTVADKSLLQAIGRSIEENSPAESIPW
ncbi:MAG: hypothetical protein HFH87_02835 [Lachnospiraceae bacterium]|nr:hypothetical protein [Lachnospiraceae bacterium]